MTLEEMGITKEELLELAANKIADGFEAHSDMEEYCKKKIHERIKEVFEYKLTQTVDAFLTETMTKLISEEIVPVNIWGERAGNPTTIRAQIAERAKDFWEKKIGDDGKETSWGGTARHEVLLKKIVAEEFTKAVKDNVNEVVAAFKVALSKNCQEVVAAHINSLVAPSRR